MSSFQPNSAFDTSAFKPPYVKTVSNDTYMYDSGLYPCPAGTEIQCCFIQNDDPLRNMVIWAFQTGHNGGDTTGTKFKVFRGRAGMVLPTANATPVILQPTNGANLTPAPATAFITASDAGLDNGALTGFVPVTMPVSPDGSPKDVGGFVGGFVVPPGGNAGCSCFMNTEASTQCTEQFLVSWVNPGSL